MFDQDYRKPHASVGIMWRLDGTRAQLATPNFSCHVDLLDPAAGLLNLSGTIADQRLPPDSAILQIHTGLTETADTLSDVYVRGSDLVATYRETGDRPVRPQIYWRALADHAGGFGLEIILSIQTSQLGIQASIETASRLPAEEPEPRQGLHLFRLSACPAVYVEMVHPSNFVGTEAERGADGWQLRHRFLSGTIEKGVIHRAMLQGLFLSSDDFDRAEELYQAFLDAAPPLTT